MNLINLWNNSSILHKILNSCEWNAKDSNISDGTLSVNQKSVICNDSFECVNCVIRLKEKLPELWFMIVCQHCYRMSPWNFGLTSVICCFECGKRVKVCRKQIAFQWNGWYGFCAPFLFSSIHLSYIFVWSAVFDSMIMVQSTD